jgi:hypothetical protein
MTYQAIITPITNIRPHPDADRVQLGTAAGYQVVVGLDTVEGTMGVFFPEGGQLAHEHCMVNKLYRKHPETLEPLGGYFEHNRRVRAQKFRGQPSEGFWQPLQSLAWTGTKLEKLEAGYQFQTLNGKQVCQKYFTPATLRAMQRKGQDKSAARKAFENFHQHFDTPKLRVSLSRVYPEAVVHVTEKLHGTSGRTGLVKVDRVYGRLARFTGWFLALFGLRLSSSYYEYLTGTRRVTLDPNASVDSGYYSGKTFRVDIHKRLKEMGLRHGETIYYEIVGFDEQGAQIMGAHPINDKKLKKTYGDHMIYKYGCSPDPESEAPNYKIYVYRITISNDAGEQFELPYADVQARCKQLGLDFVPVLDTFIYDGDRQKLMDLCAQYSHGPSLLDSTHIREGVCLRIEHPDQSLTVKYKSNDFCELEGIRKNSDDYVDEEEIS